MECPIHGDEKREFLQNEDPDEHWEAAMGNILARLSGAAHVIDDEADVLVIPKAKIHTRHDQLRLSIWDVTNAGIRERLEPLDLVEVDGRLYEIRGYVHTHREYVVRLFSFELSKRELLRLSGQVGKKLGG